MIPHYLVNPITSLGNKCNSSISFISQKLTNGKTVTNILSLDQFLKIQVLVLCIYIAMLSGQNKKYTTDRKQIQTFFNID